MYGTKYVRAPGRHGPCVFSPNYLYVYNLLSYLSTTTKRNKKKEKETKVQFVSKEGIIVINKQNTHVTLYTRRCRNRLTDYHIGEDGLGFYNLTKFLCHIFSGST